MTDIASLIIPNGPFPKSLKGEDFLTVTVANWLRELSMEAPELFVWFHVPNESTASFAYRLKQRWMGLIPGAPDFVVVCHDDAFFLELKAGPHGRLSKSQKTFQEWSHAVGINYYVCFDLETVQTIIRERIFDDHA